MVKQLNEEEKMSNKNKVLTFFLLAFPTVIIAAIDDLYVKIALVLYQFIMLKQYIDRYYEVL